MPEDDVLGRVAGQVADGRSIDWQALEQLVGSDTERAELQCLRMVDALGRAHRSDSVTHTAPAEPLHGDRPPSPVPGARPWGRYQLLQEVGAGSYGSVHRAWDPDLKKEVAIKILHRHVDDTALRARLLHEGRALARVDDPHVVRVLGVESYGNRVGLCMEFVHGDTLDAVLRSHGTLNAGEAALVGQDVCRALAAVHLAGFVHRDVKPRNIMRDRTGRIVLMDFGTGQDIVDPTGEGRMNIAGTPPYMAPEVLAGQPATVASDVYSVGVLLYHLVTSAYPVEGRTIDEITAAHLQGRRTPLGQRRPDLPLPFMGIVERAIAVRPEERWPSAATLREALGQVDGETGIDWRQIAVRLAAGLGLVAGAGGALIGLGAINSKYYNSFVLGREGFVRESLWDWMYFGALSLTAPLVLLMLALLGLSLLLVLWQLLINVSDTGRRLDAFAARAAGRL
ncbi:MAG: serine/threonine protein kinase, partial [Acidobacteriota bacterium]|nr:serine/threonine protein kinase [Acidobacteriota bacterium]